VCSGGFFTGSLSDSRVDLVDGVEHNIHADQIQEGESVMGCNNRIAAVMITSFELNITIVYS